jgi:pyruvate,water dikinase
VITESANSFTVDWEDPADAAITWSFDGMHHPAPLAPLTQHINRVNNEHVFKGRTRYVNGYAFSLLTGIPAPPREAFSKGIAIWTDDYEPRIARYCRDVVERDYDHLPAEALATEIESLFLRTAEHFQLTMIVILPFMAPTYEVLGMAQRELGEDGPRLVGTLLQGYANTTASAGLGLAALARQARESPEVARLLRARDYDGLAHASGGAEFLTQFRSYLNDYGWRLETWSSMHIPTWAEDPLVPLGLVARYLDDAAANPADAVARSARDRAAAEAEIEARLAPETRDQLLSRIASARGHVSISESRAHWQLMVFGVLRRPILALGGKLAASGTIAEPNDIFFLHWDEVVDAARRPATSFQDAVTERKADLVRWSTLKPPPFIGSPPPEDNGPGAFFARHFFGTGVAPSAEPQVVTGIGASRGVATGRARVITSLADSDRLQPGTCSSAPPPPRRGRRCSRSPRRL